MTLQDQLKNYKKPIAILTIGISGSGKSFVFNRAAFKGWMVLSADNLRKSYLVKLRREKKSLIVNGERQRANPKDAAHVFHPQLRGWVFAESQRQIRQLAQRRKNLILDLTNIHLQRVYSINLLRKYKYTVVAVVFKPRSIPYHLKNVKKRVSAGGIDISPNCAGVAADSVRRRIIVEQKKCLQAFLENLQVGRENYERLEALPVGTFRTAQNNFKKYLRDVSPKYLKTVKTLSRLDRVDEIITI